MESGEIPRVLFLTLTYESWKQVWHTRVPSEYRSTRKGNVALKCNAPVLENSTWHVLGRRQKDMTLIHRILRTESSAEFPFREIKYSHPSSKRPDSVEFGGRTRCVTREIPDEVVARREPNLPTNLTQPITVGVHTAQHIDLSKTTITENGVKESRSAGDAEGTSIIPKVVTKSGPRPISFYEEAGSGTVPAGEFTPLPDLELLQLPTSLSAFFRAIEYIKLFEGFYVGYTIARVPSASKISQLAGGDPRLYALVEVRWREYSSYILEVDGPDGHSMSTVIFSMKSHSFTPSFVARTLLSNHVTVQGAWNRPTIETLFGAQVFFARHRGRDTATWGARLGGKAMNVMFST